MMPSRTLTTATAKALEKRRKDDAYLLRNWREWHSEQVIAALAGPHKIIVRELLDACRAAILWTDLDPVALLAPFAAADPETTWIARRIVASFWGAMRENAGLVPFDDELPW